MGSGRFQLGLRLGRCTVLTNAEENIVQWMKRMDRRGLPVRRDDIVSSMQKMLEDDSDRVTPFSGRKTGKSWLQAFLRMHKGLSVQKPEEYRTYIKNVITSNGALHQGKVCHTSTKFVEPTSHQPH